MHSSTILTPFQVTSRMDFVPMPDLPREPSSSMTLNEWMESLRKGGENTKKVIAEGAEAYKNQADKH